MDDSLACDFGSHVLMSYLEPSELLRAVCSQAYPGSIPHSRETAELFPGVFLLPDIFSVS